MTIEDENKIRDKFGDKSLQFVKNIMKHSKQDLVEALLSNMEFQKRTIKQLEARIKKLTIDKERMNKKVKDFFEVY